MPLCDLGAYLHNFLELHLRDLQHAKGSTVHRWSSQRPLKVPLPIRMTARLLTSFPRNLWCKHWPEAVPPKPDRFMAHIDTAFMKKVLYITERKRKSNVHHYCKSDDFRAGFEVAKWRVFCHSAWLQISPARFKQVYSDSATQQETANKVRYH